MRRAAHFRVAGRFDRASRVQAGTLTIEAGALVVVRRHRGRRTYELPLDTVAQMVVERVVKAEIFKARLEKAAAKRSRRGGRP
jgi:hypothetical protein